MAELENLERQMKYRELLRDVMWLMDDEEEDEAADAEWEQLRTANPEHFKVAVFHAGARLHMQEADAIETGQAYGDESPDSLRHLAVDQIAYAWDFAEELGDDGLVEEVLKDARINGEVYEEAKERLESLRKSIVDALGASRNQGRIT